MKFILIMLFAYQGSTYGPAPHITAEFNSYEDCNRAVQELVRQRREAGATGRYYGGCFAKGKEPR